MVQGCAGFIGSSIVRSRLLQISLALYTLTEVLPLQYYSAKRLGLSKQADACGPIWQPCLSMHVWRMQIFLGPIAASIRALLSSHYHDCFLERECFSHRLLRTGARGLISPPLQSGMHWATRRRPLSGSVLDTPTCRLGLSAIAGLAVHVKVYVEHQRNVDTLEKGLSLQRVFLNSEASLADRMALGSSS